MTAAATLLSVVACGDTGRRGEAAGGGRGARRACERQRASSKIAKQVKVRHIPELIFKMDHSMDYGGHIDEILDGIDFLTAIRRTEEQDEE